MLNISLCQWFLTFWGNCISLSWPAELRRFHQNALLINDYKLSKMGKIWLILPYLKVPLYHPSILAHLDKFCSPIVFVASFQFVKLKEHYLRFVTEIPNITSLKSLLSSFRPQPRFFQILWRTLDLCQVNRLWESNTQLISFLIT